ncbi:MAG: hypothetical protein E7536_06940 [Ruminococcaceae bacterium]|nr:hypothetical protein [Oscillospiraceae bacterium]
MKVFVPQYFDEFTCIADKCPDTCCIGWENGILTKASVSSEKDSLLQIKLNDKTSAINKEIFDETCSVLKLKMCAGQTVELIN